VLGRRTLQHKQKVTTNKTIEVWDI